MKLDKMKLRSMTIALLLLAILEIFQDRLGIKIDTTTVVIIGMAMLTFILPDVSNLSKFKYGDIELEFEKEINHLEKLVIAEEVIDAPSKRPVRVKTVSWAHYYKEYTEILNSNYSNVEKILRASRLVELMVMEAGNDFGLIEKSELRNPAKIMKELHNHMLVSDEELSLYNEFYSFRNKIIHGEIKEISNSLTTRVLDLLWRIIKIFG